MPQSGNTVYLQALYQQGDSHSYNRLTTWLITSLTTSTFTLCLGVTGDLSVLASSHAWDTIRCCGAAVVKLAAQPLLFLLLPASPPKSSPAPKLVPRAAFPVAFPSVPLLVWKHTNVTKTFLFPLCGGSQSCKCCQLFSYTF